MIAISMWIDRFLAGAHRVTKAADVIAAHPVTLEILQSQEISADQVGQLSTFTDIY